MSDAQSSRVGIHAFFYPGPMADPAQRRQRMQVRLTFWALVAVACLAVIVGGALEVIPLGEVARQGIVWLALAVVMVGALVGVVTLGVALRGADAGEATTPAAPAGWPAFRAARSTDGLALILRGLDLAAVPLHQRQPIPVDDDLRLPDWLSPGQLAGRLGDKLSGCVVFTGQSAFEMGRLRFVSGVDEQAAREPGVGPLLAYSPMQVTVLQATAHQLIIYQGTADLVTGQQTREQISRLLWADVVEVGAVTRTTPRPLNLGPGAEVLHATQHATDLVLTKTDQTQLTLPLTRSALTLTPAPGSALPVSRYDRLIQQLTSGLLEVKQASLAAAADTSPPADEPPTPFSIATTGPASSAGSAA